MDAAASQRASGRLRAIQRRHCGSATGWPATVLTSSAAVPGRTSRAKEIGSTTSRTIISGSPTASSSIVAVTAPSTELSIAATAASQSPERTASKAAGTEAYGTGSIDSAPGRLSSAASVKVPAGPRNA